MRKIIKSLIKGYYKLSAFVVTILIGQHFAEYYGLISNTTILYIIFGLGFYLAIVELIDKFLPM